MALRSHMQILENRVSGIRDALSGRSCLPGDIYVFKGTNFPSSRFNNIIVGERFQVKSIETGLVTLSRIDRKEHNRHDREFEKKIYYHHLAQWFTVERGS